MDPWTGPELKLSRIHVVTSEKCLFKHVFGFQCFGLGLILELPLSTKCYLRSLTCRFVVFTPWKTNMDSENHWLVEENTLPGGHCQVYVSFRECKLMCTLETPPSEIS